MLKEDRQYLLEHCEERNCREWVKYFDSKYTKNQLYSACSYAGLSMKKISKEEKSSICQKNGRKYYVNQDYFKYWSRNMAYVLGLWFADGCISKNYTFDITLHSKDKYMLEYIKQELEYEGNIYDCKDRNANRLYFRCKEIYKDLINLGGTERKSLTLQFPEVPEEFLPDFIRGYFDGDGCIMRLKNNRINSAFTCGSKDFLDELLKILKEKAGVEGGSYDESCVSLKFGKRDSLRIGEYIYQNNPELFLLRKREKFMDDICV